MHIEKLAKYFFFFLRVLFMLIFIYIVFCLVFKKVSGRKLNVTNITTAHRSQHSD